MSLLEKMPRYKDAPGITAVEASDLTDQTFRHEFVDRMRPCLIRGAVHHWPAFEAWQSVDYVRRKVGNPTVLVDCAPLFLPVTRSENSDSFREMSFESFLDDLLASRSSGHRDLHGFPIEGDYGFAPDSNLVDKLPVSASKSPLAPLASDVLGFPFVGSVDAPRQFPKKRIFVYRNSYTDWHVHGTDETLVCQVRGAKDVMLLPPDDHSNRTFYEMSKKRIAFWDVDLAQCPEWETLRPHRVRLSAGDAVYIPPLWFHAVEAVGDEYGWTVSWCWGTPSHMFDPRLLRVRLDILQSITSLRAFGMVARAGWSLIRRAGMPPFSV